MVSNTPTMPPRMGVVIVAHLIGLSVTFVSSVVILTVVMALVNLMLAVMVVLVVTMKVLVIRWQRSGGGLPHKHVLLRLLPRLTSTISVSQTALLMCW